MMQLKLLKLAKDIGKWKKALELWKMKCKYTCAEIINTLRNVNFYEISGDDVSI